jgi:phage major head subunit gpT-like protein
MLVNAANLHSFFIGLKTAFNEGFSSYPSVYRTVAMEVTSSSAEEKYGWLGQFPNIREWIGDRIIHSLEVHDHEIKNRKFEMTISVDRTSLEDDRYGIYAPMVKEVGRAVAEHPDSLVFELLKAGFTTACYDGSSSTPTIR